MTVTTGSMFTWLIGLLCIFFISGFICQVLYVQIEHRDLPIYSQILSLLIYHSVTFSYIYISFIVSGYSYYVNMLVTRLKSDMCLVFLLNVPLSSTAQLILSLFNSYVII